MARDILPEEFKTDEYFGNCMLKYGAYTFYFKLKYCNALRNYFLAGFKERVELYPEGHSKHGTLVIHGVDYLEYNGYGIHKGSKILKIERLG